MKFFIFAFIVLALSSCSNAVWTDNVDLKLSAEAKTPIVPPVFTVNLDLPQSERWVEIGEKYKDQSWQLVNYLRENLPKGWLKPIEKLAAKFMPFFKDYGE